MTNRLDNVINSPQQQYTKEEAEEILKKLRILDENGKLKEEFKNIFIKENK